MQALSRKRVENTFRLEDTGRTRTVYFNEDGVRVKKRDLIMNEVYGVTTEKVLLRVNHPRSDWVLADWEPRGWFTHPVGIMWRDNLQSLLKYQVAVCTDWTKFRHYQDTCLSKSMFLFGDVVEDNPAPPWWLGDPEVHLSHRSNLVRKLPEFYGPLFSDAVPDMPYKWPKLGDQ